MRYAPGPDTTTMSTNQFNQKDQNYEARAGNIDKKLEKEDKTKAR